APRPRARPQSRPLPALPGRRNLGHFRRHRAQERAGMMASEGVISTLFYRLVNDRQLRESYRDDAFYSAFHADRANLTPYDNINLKLFAAMNKLRGAPATKPSIIALLDRYASLFPEDAKRVYSVFLDTTWGATASRDVAQALRQASRDGHSGNMAAFRQSRPFPRLDALIADVTSGKVALDANLGPELWVTNSDFKIASAAWSQDRSHALSLNLNTASVVEFMTIHGVDLPLARCIVALRDSRG